MPLLERRHENVGTAVAHVAKGEILNSTTLWFIAVEGVVEVRFIIACIVLIVVIRFIVIVGIDASADLGKHILHCIVVKIV